MRQYRGKTSKSSLKVGKDITGISGATISSRSATFAVKKAIVLYEELYLK
jgi:Na+-translocating ferredoxin:NAD+ oxidoreductase RnfG subunit